MDTPYNEKMKFQLYVTLEYPSKANFIFIKTNFKNGYIDNATTYYYYLFS